MTAATLAPGRAAAPARPSAPTPGLTFGGVLRAEWIKTWSLRSTFWSLAVAVVLMVGITWLYAWSAAGDEGTWNIVVGDLLGPGTYFAQLVVATLGVLAISGEYSTGQIRSTVVAVPRRTPVLAAKAIVLTAVTAGAALVGMVAATGVAMPFFDDLGITLDLSDGETLRMLGGVPLFLAGIALLGFAVGALVRSTPGALSIVLGLILVVESVISAIPLALFDRIEPFLPASAGSRIVQTQETLDSINAASIGADLGPWQGYAVLLAWVVVGVTAAAGLMRRRDA